MSDIRSLLPPNSSPLLRATEAATAEPKRNLEAPIYKLWRVDTCPEELLGHMAWTLSVDFWRSDWPVETKRAVIRAAIDVHRSKGTRAAVQTALGALGFATEITEAWENDGAPHTFRVDAFGADIFGAGHQIDQALVQSVEQIVHSVKPARSQFSFQIGERFTVPACARLGVKDRLRECGRLKPEPRTHVAVPRAYARLGVKDKLRETGRLTPAPRTHVATVPAAIRLGLRDQAVMRAEHTITPRYGAAYAR